MKKPKNRVYITPVIKGKQKHFINYLGSLSIKREDLTIKANGDFYMFFIDLSKKSNEEYGKIRKALNQKQVAFLK